MFKGRAHTPPPAENQVSNRGQYYLPLSQFISDKEYHSFTTFVCLLSLTDLRDEHANNILMDSGNKEKCQAIYRTIYDSHWRGS